MNNIGKHDSRLEHVYRAAVAVAGAHDVETALQIIADSAREVAQAEMAALGVPGSPGQPMAHFVVAGLPAEAVRRAGRPPMGLGVLGVLLKEGKNVRVRDVREHPAFSGMPSHHPVVRSFLGVPVRAGGEIIGDLYLANRLDGDEFTPEDERLIEMLATHAAVVIQSLHYHQQAQRMAVLQARQQTARLIEDHVLQAMYGAGLLLGTLDLNNPSSAAARIQDIQAQLDNAITSLRQHLLALTASEAE
jgi:GAF domain-containing protein